MIEIGVLEGNMETDIVGGISTYVLYIMAKHDFHTVVLCSDTNNNDVRVFRSGSSLKHLSTSAAR